MSFLILFSYTKFPVSASDTQIKSSLPIIDPLVFQLSDIHDESANTRAAIDDFWKYRTVNSEKTKLVDLPLIFNWKHFDIFVRYLYVKAYVENIEYDKYKELYEKMQIKRIGKCDIVAFNKLIDSFKENGYLSQFPIPVTDKMELLNGSHRLACCLYFKINPYVEIIDAPAHDYPLNWFRENDFSDKEISELIKTGVSLKEQLCQIYDENNFIGIIWNVSQEFYEQIFTKISLCNSIVWVQKYQLGDRYTEFVKDIYKFDGIADWKIDRKIEFMCKNPCRNVIVFSINIPNVKYKFDENKDKAVCLQVEVLKSQIRSAYKDKVTPYVFDIVFHMADDDVENYYLNKSLQKYLPYCVVNYRLPSVGNKFKKSNLVIEKNDRVTECLSYEDLLLKLGDIA